MDLSAYFRSVMELSHGIVVTLDTDGRVIYGNTLLERTTGCDIADMRGKDWFFLVVPEAHRHRERRQFERCSRQSAISSFRGRLLRRDGQTVHMAWRLKPLADTESGTPGVMMVGHDITEDIARKEALDTERELQVQLRHADRLAKIGQLAAGVAHELNEPLANILGFAQLAVKAEGLPPQVVKDIEHIVRSSLHAREVIKKLLLFSRQVPPQKMRININSVIEDALVLSAASALRSGVAVNCDLATGLPEIIADPQQLKQVVINLAANAIHAMTDGGRLNIRTHAGPEHVFMSVEDTGCGMDTDTLEQVFTPFFTTKDMDQGVGLGLSVVHGIVRAHGGSIDVHSTVGKGTTFTVCFPLTD